jgi:uncharacterized protein (UPF0548 family)
VTDRGAELTYAEVGATRSDDLPAGYRHVRRRVAVGTGPDAFAGAVAGMKDWQIHRGAGLRLRPATATPQVGSDFAAGLRLLAVTLWIPCRVVWLRDDASCYGYGFGTVPGHPEAGEEAFMVSLGDDGEVWFTLRAFSRPVVWYARLGGPVTAWLQQRVTDRYVAAARQLSDGPSTRPN